MSEKKYYCPSCGHVFSQEAFERGYDARWRLPENWLLPCCGADGWASLSEKAPRLEATIWYHRINDVHIWPDGQMSIVQDV